MNCSPALQTLSFSYSPCAWNLANSRISITNKRAHFYAELDEAEAQIAERQAKREPPTLRNQKQPALPVAKQKNRVVLLMPF